MSTDWNGTDFADGCATYGGLADELRALKAQARWQTQRGNRYRDRFIVAEAQLMAEQAIVHRVRTLPRYTTAVGDRVVSAAALDRALGGAR